MGSRFSSLQKRWAAALACTLAILSANSLLKADTIVLDDFSAKGTDEIVNPSTNWPMNLGAGGFGGFNIEEGVAGTIGGVRERQGTPAGSISGTAIYDIDTANSWLDYEGATTASGNLLLTYYGTDGGTPTANLNVPAYGGTFTFNFSELNFALAGAGQHTLVVEAGVAKNDGSSTLVFSPTSTFVTTSGAQTVTLDVPNSYLESYSTADAFFIALQPVKGTQFHLDSVTFTSVPEPGAIVLFATGVLGLAWRRFSRG